MRRVLAFTALAGVPALVQLAPVASSLTPARRALAPRLSGVSPRRHIALTYDDGPDLASTPAFLELLTDHGVTATFFLLGEHVVTARGLVQEMSSEGHELAIHGWSHRCLVGVRPGGLGQQLAMSRDVLEDLTGRPVTWYRPPYGVLIAEGVLAAHSLGLKPVLWSAWGRDWSRGSSALSIERCVTRQLTPGGTVLLHDTDRTSAPGSWRATLSASDSLLSTWRQRQIPVGTLAAHW